MSTEQTIANKPITLGAGVDPHKRIVPSKRIKAMHRAADTKLSLKAWVRSRWQDTPGALMEAWLDSKAR